MTAWGAPSTSDFIEPSAARLDSHYCEQAKDLDQLGAFVSVTICVPASKADSLLIKSWRD
jgi:hypothetical protein